MGSNPALDYGLAGAVLLDLALAGRVEVVDKRGRLKEISQDDWASDATRRAIEQTQAAVMSAVVAATAATTAAAGS